MTMCGTLTISSVAVNCLVALQLLVSQSLRLLTRIHAARARATLSKSGHIEEFVRKNTTNIASLLTDGLANLALFGGGLYLLTAGKAITQPFTPQTDHTTTTAGVIFSLAIGRLCFAFVADLLRLRTVSSATSASFSVMQCVEHVVALVSLVLITEHGEALLSGTTLLIMGIDSNLYTCSIQLERLRAESLAGLRLGLKVLQCFLSLAFRLAVPLVCLMVAMATSSPNLADMRSQSVAVVVSTAIFYCAYNCWMIYRGARGVWGACGSRDTQQQKPGPAMDYLANNISTCNKSQTKNIPLTFNITKDNHTKTMNGAQLVRGPVPSFTDLAYINDSPPPYENYRRLPTSADFFYHSTNVPDISHALPAKCLHSPPLLIESTSCDSISNRTNQQVAFISHSARRKRLRAKILPTVVPAGLKTIPEDKESLSGASV